jgi:hypothetical protein
MNAAINPKTKTLNITIVNSKYMAQSALFIRKVFQSTLKRRSEAFSGAVWTSSNRPTLINSEKIGKVENRGLGKNY